MEWVIASAVIFAIHNSILQITCPHFCYKKLFLAMHLCSWKKKDDKNYHNLVLALIYLIN